MSVKLLAEHHLEFLSFKGGCSGSSESTHVKMPHCWKSHVMAQILIVKILIFVWVQYIRKLFICYSFCSKTDIKNSWGSHQFFFHKTNQYFKRISKIMIM